jgi:toluene monooxygenase electron transfer component
MQAATTTIFSSDGGCGAMKIAIQSKSGEQAFICGDRETILHAGLRQGTNLPYECATGTCGTCRARVMSGEYQMAWKEAPGAARLKPEKGDILMCQTRPLSDCVLRVPAEITASKQPIPALRRGVIRNIKKLTGDVAHFHVHLSEPITFEAGQFVVIETGELTGGRAYSMVNFDPSPVDRLDLVLKRKPSGRFSDWLFAERQSDETVEVFGPLGRAVFRPSEDRDIVCIAGGSGIAGMMSILEHAVSADYFRDHKGVVFFGVRTHADAFYLNELSNFAQASHGNLEVIVALSHEASVVECHEKYPALKLATGMVHEVAEKNLNGRSDAAIAYVAGPPPMVDGAIRSLVMNGFSVGSIRYDKFG